MRRTVEIIDELIQKLDEGREIFLTAKRKYDEVLGEPLIIQLFHNFHFLSKNKKVFDPWFSQTLEIIERIPNNE